MISTVRRSVVTSAKARAVGSSVKTVHPRPGTGAQATIKLRPSRRRSPIPLRPLSAAAINGSRASVAGPAPRAGRGAASRVPRWSVIVTPNPCR